MRYSILDPTGNITALVESEVEIARQLTVADAIMRRHREVEQVGFLYAADAAEAEVGLRMAGGEFCGNATISAAALHLMRGGAACETGGKDGDMQLVRVDASGAREPVEVRLWKTEEEAYRAQVHMPPAVGIRTVFLRHGGIKEQLPLVEMEGISHLIIESDSAFYPLRDEKSEAESAVRSLCHELEAEGLGFIFLGGSELQAELLPLVYIKSAESLFWENSCASGTAATGYYLAKKRGEDLSLGFKEPGGVLEVRTEKSGDELWLGGSVKCTRNMVL